MTKSLQEGRTQFVNMIPKILLRGEELEQMAFLEECSADGWIPKLDTFQDQFMFLPQETEIPLKILFDTFCKKRRADKLTEMQQEFFTENDDNNGLDDFLIDCLKKTQIPNPEIIDYATFDRQQLDQDIYRLSTGISYFDKIFGGVLKGGELVCLMASTKVGKTTTLRLLAEFMFWGMANNTLCPGVSVMIHSQEMSTHSMLESFDFARIGKNSAKSREGISPEIMAEMSQVQKAAHKLKQKLYITPTVSTAQEIKDYYYSCEIKPKVIFVDGFNILGKGGDNSFGSIGAEMKELKEFAIAANIIIIGVNQTNRDGIKKGMAVDHTSISGSIAIAYYCDFLISLSRQMAVPMEGDQPVPHTYFKPVLCRPTACDPSLHFLIEFRYDDQDFTPIFIPLDPNWSPDELYLTAANKGQAKEAWSSELKEQVVELAQLVGEDAAEEVVGVIMEQQASEESSIEKAIPF